MAITWKDIEHANLIGRDLVGFISGSTRRRRGPISAIRFHGDDVEFTRAWTALRPNRNQSWKLCEPVRIIMSKKDPPYGSIDGKILISIPGMELEILPPGINLPKPTD